MPKSIARIAPEMARRMVFVTGSAHDPEIAAFLRRTSCAWLEKPVKGESLRSAIAQARRQGAA